MCRIVETTPSPRPPDAETDSAGEGADRRETTDIMSPDPDIAMDTSGVVPGEHDQSLDTEKIEIIASTLEEICTFLNQAQHLIVSALLLVTCMTLLMCYKDVLSTKNALIYENHMRATVTLEQKLLMHNNETAKETPRTQNMAKHLLLLMVMSTCFAMKKESTVKE